MLEIMFRRKFDRENFHMNELLFWDKDQNKVKMRGQKTSYLVYS